MKKFKPIYLLPSALLTLILLFSFKQNSFSQTAAGNLDQIRNGSATSPNNPGNWVNGNANAVQAHYSEGWSIPYRMIITDLVNGSHDLIIEWDTKDNGKHAIDYITSYNNLDYPVDSHLGFGHTAELIDPTIGISGLGAPSTFPIPAPGSVGASIAGQPTSSFNNLPNNLRLMTIYNGTITAIDYINQDNLGPASTKTSIKITFTSTAPTAVIAWGGHIAAEYDWGMGNGATSISGSPYHTRLISIDGAGGNQDRQLAASAVFIPVRCSITGNLDLCPNSSPVTYTATILNPSSSAVTYSWALENNTAGAVISGSSSGASISVVPAGSNFIGGGSYTVKLTVTRDGISHTCYLGSETAPGSVVKVGWCNPEIICTYTLDFYGDEPETACGADGSQIATVATMSSALSNVGNTKIFGIQANNQTFTLNQNDISAGGNIFTMLPGTPGTSSALIGNTSFNGAAIDNPLLAHTMVLFFNLQTSPALGSLELTNNMWTQQIDCATGALIPGTNLLTQMPESVISYLFNPNNGYTRTIAGLFSVANDALGGKDLGDENVIAIPSFDELKTAVERINAAFNQCRRLVPANINATGFIYNDDDGMTDGVIDFEPGSVLNGPALGGVYLTLIEGDAIDANGNNTGQILKVAPIDQNGNYLFDPVVNGTYTINMGITPTGDRKPIAPAGKVFTAEGGTVINGKATGDGMPNGRIVMTVLDDNPPIFHALRKAAPLAVLNDLNYGIADATLPVGLMYFDAKVIENGNKLTWKTANEKNFSHFEIQKSLNAKEFGTIGNVFNNNASLYNFTDMDISEGTIYYRLKLVDNDNTFEYSKVISINIEKGRKYIIVENPANNGELKINTNFENPIFNFSTINGVQVDFSMVESGKNKYQIKLKNSKPGIYILNTVSNGQIKSSKIIVP